MIKRVAIILVTTAVIGAHNNLLYAQVPQSQQTTRAREQCELKALEGTGYRPSEEDFYYPRNLQAAQARLEAQHKSQGQPPGRSCDGASRSSGQGGLMK